MRWHGRFEGYISQDKHANNLKLLNVVHKIMQYVENEFITITEK